ncbi:MAG: inositol-3-phosphate synthase [Planctomycetota bacterium]|nr:inositol-3-phosphate synthase [Planctomycetota bacterium]
MTSRHDATQDGGRRKTGVWLIGACGAVSTLTIVGARAVARGFRKPVGLLTETPLLDGLDLPALDDLVFGGHEIRDTDLHCSAAEFAERAGILDPALLQVLREDLRAVDRDIKPGYLVNPSGAVQELATRGNVGTADTAGEIVDAIQADLRAFQQKHDLETVVVINVSSTEPPAGLPIEFADLDAFRACLDEPAPRAGLTSSVLNAYAALDLGFPFVNFTPSPGSTIPALAQLAEERGVPHMGADGKTGETLVKTALAPLFAGRALKVLSWEGYNMLGNRDGFVLNDPDARESKTRSKDRAVKQILGDEDTHSQVTIDYVPSLDDWKVAWDYIHFEGFLGTRMSMQFTWQGNDSALAAPLVLDLARLASFARSQGERGVMTHTAAYFKSPAGTEEQNFVKQLGLLEAYVAKHRALKAKQKKARS